jgi:glutaredoxin
MYPDVKYMELPGEYRVPGAYVYGLSTCSHCAEARAFLTEEGISVNAMLLDRLPAERRHAIQADFEAEYGAKPIYPVLEVGGKLYFGFNREVWRALLLGNRS